MESFMGDLSACETMIMKVIWDAKEDIALQDLIRELADRYKKNYARTTVVTFVHKIVDKGFATTYRKGKAAYIHPEKSLAGIGMSCYTHNWALAPGRCCGICTPPWRSPAPMRAAPAPCSHRSCRGSPQTGCPARSRSWQSGRAQSCFCRRGWSGRPVPENAPSCRCTSGARPDNPCTRCRNRHPGCRWGRR